MAVYMKSYIYSYLIIPILTIGKIRMHFSVAFCVVSTISEMPTYSREVPLYLQYFETYVKTLGKLSRSDNVLVRELVNLQPDRAHPAVRIGRISTTTEAI